MDLFIDIIMGAITITYIYLVIANYKMEKKRRNR